MKKKAIVIGAGFSGMSAAATLARDGWDVTVLEQHPTAGGRARQYSADGFTWDMGPSWYWMPDVFERFFRSFGKEVKDYYTLHRLDPSYRVCFGENDVWDIPADPKALRDLFEKTEKGAAQKLDQFLREAEYKYRLGVQRLVYKPGRSLLEFADREVLSGIFRLHIFKSFAKYTRKYFRDPRLIQLMEFPVLFLGSSPGDTPALYSLMNYADMTLGTWYPEGGMYAVVRAMQQLAEEQGVKFVFNTPVRQIRSAGHKATTVVTDALDYTADVVLSSGDYHHTEKDLLAGGSQSYNSAYWDKRVMAPSCILYYLGIRGELPQMLHHTLYFDQDFARHTAEIYDTPQWPTNPLMYASCTSRTDAHVAPEGHENVMVLIPVAPGMPDTPEVRDHYFRMVMDRLEKYNGGGLQSRVVFRRDYAHNDFVRDYNAFRGNAYGLANTLRQTAIFKPSIRSRKLENLYYAGQLTVPGPGVPPAIISGQVAASEIMKDFTR